MKPRCLDLFCGAGGASMAVAAGPGLSAKVGCS